MGDSTAHGSIQGVTAGVNPAAVEASSLYRPLVTGAVAKRSEAEVLHRTAQPEGQGPRSTLSSRSLFSQADLSNQAIATTAITGYSFAISGRWRNLVLERARAVSARARSIVTTTDSAARSPRITARVDPMMSRSPAEATLRPPGPYSPVSWQACSSMTRATA